MGATERRAGGTGWSGRPAALAVAVALVLPAGPAVAPLDAQEEARAVRYARPLPVPEAGWVRVPVGPEVLRRIEGGGGLRLFGPEGEEVPFARRAGESPSPRRPVEVDRPVPADGGWWVPLEVAPGARPHDRLLLRIEGGGEPGAAAVRLEGRADGGAWQLLVVGTLRSEGDRWSLVYPPTELPHLRLGWPRGAREGDGEAAAPRLAGAVVEEVPPRSYRLSVARPDCRAPEASSPASPRTVCRLAVGGSGRYLRRLCLAVTTPGPAAYRLLDARDGNWATVAEGTWSLPGEGLPRCLPLDLTLTGEADALRLELFSGEEEPPAIRDVAAELAPEVLVFQAARAGLHTLAYGPAVLRTSREGELSVPRGTEAATVEPGPEESTEVAVSSLTLQAAPAPGPAVVFDRTWKVTAEAPEPGRLFRLSLPPELYGVARPDLADVRLLAAGEPSRVQVPYAQWRPEEPVLAAELREAAEPSPEVQIPAPDLPLSALVVSAAPWTGEGAEGFRRRLRVRYRDVTGEDDDTVGPWVDWRCPDRPPLPCRVTVPLEATGARRLTVELEAGAGATATAPRLDIELWRRRDVLLFPWPADGSNLLLAAGSETLEPPAYELAERLPELLARPWREATLATQGAGEGSRLASVAITVALLAAAAALLLLLHRILEE